MIGVAKQPITPRQELPQSVGIVGAGPGGLAAAEMLRRRGYQVTVYDRHDRPATHFLWKARVNSKHRHGPRDNSVGDRRRI